MSITPSPQDIMAIVIALSATIGTLAVTFRKAGSAPLLWRTAFASILLIQTALPIMTALSAHNAPTHLLCAVMAILHLLSCVAYGFAFIKMQDAAESALDNEQHQTALLQKEAEAHRQANLEKRIADSQGIRQDLMRHVNALEEALRLNDPTSAEQQAAQSLELLDSTRVMHYCANKAVDAVLQAKAQECKDAAVPFHFLGTIPAETAVDTLDLCSVFFNLIDNAIHANQEVPPSIRGITIITKQHKGYLVITATNPAKALDMIKTAQNKSLLRRHGWGQEILTEIASRYHGKYTLDFNPLSQAGNSEDLTGFKEATAMVILYFK